MGRQVNLNNSRRAPASSPRPAKEPKEPREKSKHPVLKFLGRTLATLLCLGIMVGSLVAVGAVYYVVQATANDGDLLDLDNIELSQSSTVVATDPDTGAQVEYETLRSSNSHRVWADLEQIPTNLQYAFICTEDKDFYNEPGVNFKRTIGAMVNEYLLPIYSSKQGASTLEQQLIKNLTSDKSASGVEGALRKLREIYRALCLSRSYSKETILEAYLNTISFTGTIQGVQTAANEYFNKDVSQLSLWECATIASITKNPTNYNPYTNPENLINRRNFIMYNMWQQGVISEEDYRNGAAQPLVLAEEDSGKKPSTVTSYFTDALFNEVVQDIMVKEGISESEAQKLLYTGGYQIYATIDPELQSIVEKVYADTSNLPYTSSKGEQLQSGMTVIDNATGNIVAMAGRVGEREGRFLFNYATATRPCGSAIKPIAVYAPALDTGVITPATVLDDYPVRLQANENGTEKAWPKNSYSGYKGLITLQTALRVSTNTTAVRVLEALSPSVSYDFMTQNLGFTTLVNSDLNSAALGLGGLTYGVNTVEMAAAYSAFANNGVYTRPRTYIEVRDNKGNLVLENKQESWVAMKESTAYSINELLKGVVRSGTGTEAAFSGMTIAGKTGTTSSNYDRYFVGYTPYYTAAVWIGYDQNASIRANGNPAAQLWKKVMSEAHENLPNQNFNGSTADMTQVTVCTRTGLLQGPGCTDVQTVWVAASNAPALVCDGHVAVNLCTESGKLATEYCPAECVQSVNAIDFTTENLTAAWGYERTTILLPLSAAEYEAYAAQQAADPTFVIPAGKPVQANDSGSVFSDLMMLGPCTLHQYVEPEPMPDEGYYDENGNWVPAGETDPTDPTDPEGSEEVSPEQGTDFLNWLLNTAA